MFWKKELSSKFFGIVLLFVALDKFKEAQYIFLKSKKTRFRSKILYIDIFLGKWN